MARPSRFLNWPADQSPHFMAFDAIADSTNERRAMTAKETSVALQLHAAIQTLGARSSYIAMSVCTLMEQ